MITATSEIMEHFTSDFLSMCLYFKNTECCAEHTMMVTADNRLLQECIIKMFLAIILATLLIGQRSGDTNKFSSNVNPGIQSISPVHQSSPAIQSTIQSSPVIIDTTNTNFIRKKPNGAFNSLITYKNNIVSKQVTNVHEDTSPPCRDVSSLTTHVQYPVT